MSEQEKFYENANREMEKRQRVDEQSNSCLRAIVGMGCLGLVLIAVAFLMLVIGAALSG